MEGSAKQKQGSDKKESPPTQKPKKNTPLIKSNESDSKAPSKPEKSLDKKEAPKKSTEKNANAEDGTENVQLQRVFVEELGKELLMDDEGNLFDLEGNFMGKAAGDDEEENGNDNPELEELP